MDKPNDKLPGASYEKFVEALANRNLGIEELLDAAWTYYQEAGCPYGDTAKGLALWIERTTGTTAN